MKATRLLNLTSFLLCSTFVESTFLALRGAHPAFVSTHSRGLTKPITISTHATGPQTTIPSPLLSNFGLPMKTELSSDALNYDTNQEYSWSPKNLQTCSSQWDLTPDETTSLMRLGQRLEDIIPGTDTNNSNSPFQVIRFLKEFKNDEQIVEKKFRAMMEWRRNNNVDDIMASYRPPSLYRYFPAAVLRGVDKQGDPIHLERTGVADSSGLLNRYGRQEMIKQAIWLRELQTHGNWHKTYELEQGHPVKQFSIVMDMKGLSMKNIGPSLLSVAQEVSRIVQDNYPGYTKRIFVVRAPPIFQIAYNAIKPFIDPSMIEKVIVVGDKDYCQVLEQYMDLEVLPAEVCPQGRGEAVEDFQSVVWKGGKIPKHEEEVLEPLHETQITATTMMDQSTEKQEKLFDQNNMDVIDTKPTAAAAEATTTATRDTDTLKESQVHPPIRMPNSLRLGRKRLGHFAIVQTKRLKDGFSSLVGGSNHDHPYAI